MKRPSIYDPRVPSVNEDRQLERPTSGPGAGSGHHARPSLLVKLPVETQIINNHVSAKRKRGDDAPAQRVTRPKLTNNRTAAREPIAAAVKPKKSDEGRALNEPIAVSSDDVPTPVASTRKTHGKQKLAVDHPATQVVAQTSPRKSKQPAVTVAKPTVSVAGTVKSRKTISKSKPAVDAATQQHPPPQAGPSSSKQAPTAVKKEVKSGRQPPGACKSCRLRHQKCDRMHPACERCTKLGISCEYSQLARAAAKDADCKQDLRGRSVTVSPEAPRHNSPSKRQTPASPSKKSVATAAPTAASTRAPRVKKAPNPKAFPQKQK
ncbi:hypothetical protein EKO04_002179 [Ascochyta lentis]|uniref:Zn(2)-C6 fungal-type domain-containing protein n=1 Tax=Ascochyta lentis TaxID=205686 RepID=A0A8H7JA92_9PLEO|nr:hypothetical protein EKO04_002179 [Ascochyta lentis]